MYNKFIVAVIGAILTGLNAFLGLDFDIGADKIAGVVIPVLTALGVFQIANKE